MVNLERNHRAVVYQEAVTTLERLARSGDHVMVRIEAEGVGSLDLFDSPVDAHDGLIGLKSAHDALDAHGGHLTHVSVRRDETGLGITH